MTSVNPFFASKTAEASISALFGTAKAEAASTATAITVIVAAAPTVSAAPPTASNEASGRITAALIATPASSDSQQAVLPPINKTASTPREVAIAEVNALVVHDIPDFFDRPVEPVTFSSGESAIAMGWSYIGELESTVSAVNTANRALNGHSVETARSLFGDEAADAIQKMNESNASDTESMLEYQISTINRAFSVSGKLVQTDDSGKLSMGRFTLTYDGGNFRATVGTDQYASVTWNSTEREVSVHQVSADLVSGKLSL